MWIDDLVSQATSASRLKLDMTVNFDIYIPNF